MFTRLRSILAQHRWPATRAAARLGVIAATLTGVALAFHFGGRDGYAVPLSALLGAPANVLLRFVPNFHVASSGPASEWGINQLYVVVAIALNWTAIGVVVDLLRPKRLPPRPEFGSREPLHLTETEFDPLLAAFDRLEREAGKARDRDSEDPTSTSRAA